MLPFQNTTLYRQTLEFFSASQKLLSENSSQPVIRKIAEELLNLQTLFAQAIEFYRQEELHKSLVERSEHSLTSVATLLDLAKAEGLLPNEKCQNIFLPLEKFHSDLKNFTKKQKRILILSAEMGQGHLSAAKAVQEGIEKLYGFDYSVEIVDFMLLLSERINRVSQKTYESWAKNMPAVCNFIFESFDRKWSMKMLNKVNYTLVLSKVKKYFSEKNPDLIISTFPVWDHLALEIVKKINPRLKFISVITDSIRIHNAWVTADIDYHIVANDETARSIEALGVPPEKIKALGFPLRLKFMETVNREQFLKEQGLDPKKFTILFLPAAQKNQRNLAIMKKLRDEASDCNVIVITGRDKKIQFDGLELETRDSIKVIGWTDEIHKFIKGSDMVITKGGGATVMECVAAEKPLIITWIIARHEGGNAELVKEHQAGFIDTDPKSDLMEHVREIRKNYDFYTGNLKKISNPSAALKIAEFIEGLLDKK